MSADALIAAFQAGVRAYNDAVQAHLGQRRTPESEAEIARQVAMAVEPHLDAIVARLFSEVDQLAQLMSSQTFLCSRKLASFAGQQSGIACPECGDANVLHHAIGECAGCLVRQHLWQHPGT